MSSSKKSWFGGFVAAIAIASSGAAQAVPLTWTQTFAPLPKGYVYLSGGAGFSYSHDLTKGLMAPLIGSSVSSPGLYSNSTNTAFTSFGDFRDGLNLISAKLTLYFADDNDNNYEEYVKYRVEDNSLDNDWSSWSSWIEVDGTICNNGSIFKASCLPGYDDVVVGPVSLNAILDDNKLKVELDSKDYSYKDFYFKGSMLTICADIKPREEAPEPATLGLLGLGLVGLGAIRRRRKAT